MFKKRYYLKNNHLKNMSFSVNLYYFEITKVLLIYRINSTWLPVLEKQEL